MIYRSVLGLLVISLLTSCLWGQGYYPSAGQSIAPATANSFPTQSNSWDVPVPATPHTPTHPAASPQFAFPLSNTPTPYSSPYSSPYPATPQLTTPQIASPTSPYATPYASRYPAPYTRPYAAPYATTPPQVTAPELAPPNPLTEEAATVASETVEPDTAEPAAHEEAVEESAEEAVLLEEEESRAWYYAPVYWFDLWEGNVELGLSGSHGNSETLNYLVGLDAKRETDTHTLDFDLKYDRKSANSIETAHRLFSEIRWELLFEDSCWTWFFHETTEYDEFKAYDLRLSYDTGLGRCLIKNDDTSLLARAGAGFSHEIGSPNDELVPEAVFGMEFDHKLNERQKVSASSEYSPDVTDFLDYRLKSKASWEVLLDEETNLSLKVSILDRYDSTPNGKKANDLDYTLTLLWSF